MKQEMEDEIARNNKDLYTMIETISGNMKALLDQNKIMQEELKKVNEKVECNEKSRKVI